MSTETAVDKLEREMVEPKILAFAATVFYAEQSCRREPIPVSSNC